jgi:hypothetical protein
MAQLTLQEALDSATKRYEVFTVCTPFFWSRRRSVVLGFFANLRALGTVGFLASHSASVCADAASAGVDCVLTRHFEPSRDRMMSKARWFVLDRFLASRRRVTFAGADIRFIAPVARMFDVSGIDGPVDATFEGRVGQGLLTQFTPDLIMAFATDACAAFVRQVLTRIDSEPSTDGLPPQLRSEKQLLKHDLMGPAQQE